MKVYRVTCTRVRDSRHFQTDLTGFSAKRLSRHDFAAKCDSSRFSDVKLLKGSKRPGRAASGFETLDSDC